MAKKLSPYAADIIKTCMAFGLTLGLQLYIIGVLFGGWLDRRLGTEPLCLILGILAAIFLSFYRLIIDFKKAAEAEDARIAAGEVPHKKYIKYKRYDPMEDEYAIDPPADMNPGENPDMEE